MFAQFLLAATEEPRANDATRGSLIASWSYGVDDEDEAKDEDDEEAKGQVEDEAEDAREDCKDESGTR